MNICKLNSHNVLYLISNDRSKFAHSFPEARGRGYTINEQLTSDFNFITCNNKIKLTIKCKYTMCIKLLVNP